MTSLDFAEAAKRLGACARRAGSVAPSFRSPPRVRGCRRSIQRRRNGSATVAVAFKGRPTASVLADMIDGILAANDISGVAASTLQDRLWAAVGDLVIVNESEANESAASARSADLVPIATARERRAA